MNFRPELAEKVMAGAKTVTRRLTSDNPNSPWWRYGCGLKVGGDYAVCPGRGKNAIGRVLVRDVQLDLLGYLDDDEARREGFADAAEFVEAFRAINGKYNALAPVWRIEFEVVQL